MVFLIIKYILFYGSLLVFPFLYLLYRWGRNGVSRWILVPLAILSGLFIDARFIEPYFITHNTWDMEMDGGGTTTIRAVVYSDMHAGVYRSKKQIARDVATINALKPDIILMPGDFIYELSEDKLVDTFAAYRQFTAPAFAVAGNHDSEKPGDIASEVVRDAVSESGIRFIDNGNTVISFKGKDLQLYGLSDIWEGNTDMGTIEAMTDDEHSIVLVHNPDAVYDFPSYAADLVVSGHTHAGQVRIPWLYKKAIPTEYSFDRWWYQFEDMRLFITAGTGMVGLPLRFLNPAQVDVIDIHL